MKRLSKKLARLLSSIMFLILCIPTLIMLFLDWYSDREDSVTVIMNSFVEVFANNNKKY